MPTTARVRSNNSLLFTERTHIVRARNISTKKNHPQFDFFFLLLKNVKFEKRQKDNTRVRNEEEKKKENNNNNNNIEMNHCHPMISQRFVLLLMVN